jgi:DNA-binding SARP family transcriptional activator
MLEVRLLGPLEVRDRERTIPLPRQKQRALLAALVLRRGQVVSQDRLVEELWGKEAPRAALQALHNYVSQLRKALGPDVLLTRPPGYVVELEPEQVDVERFERLVADAQACALREREAKLREALELFRGPPLADLTFEPFAQAEVPRLEELEVAAREALVDARLELGGHAEVVSELEALVVRHPYRERLHGQLMLALYRSGRQAEALAAYQQARRALVAELGIEPGDALHGLERAILRQDPSLRPPAREKPAGEAPEPPQAPAPRPSRKTVTVLVSGLVSASTLAEELDPEALRRLHDRYSVVARAAAERHGGSVERATGQAVTAVFGVPLVHEDDALRALRAAVDLRDELAASDSAGRRLDTRIGVSTGEVLVDGEALTTGGAVSLAERLAREARPGEIILGEQTRRLVQEVASVEEVRLHEPPDDRAPLAFRLVELAADSYDRVLRLDSPLVGRERQVGLLSSAFENVVADRACHLFTVLGPAGVGKSRLVREFLERLGEGAAVLQGRCLPYGEGITFWPLIEALRQAAASFGAEAEAVLELAGGTGPAEETFAAARRLFESLARLRPLVVVFDDLHWAEPTFLDLVEELAQWSREAPVLVLCLARPELHDLRPAWGGGKPNASSVTLEPLTNEECERLVDNLLGDSRLVEPVRAYVVGAADGNPLVVEELLAMLVDRDVLRLEGGHWTSTQMPAIGIPPSVHALLASRIDRLPDAERLVIELASVEGKRFDRVSVVELADDELRPHVDTLLAALVHREFVRPLPDGDDTFSFRHQLVRDAAYASIPKQARAELHERYAAWLEHRSGRRTGEIEEILGYHLEQASGLRAELGPLDEHGQTLARSAAARLESAGRRALARADERAATKLFRRAVELLPAEAPERLALMHELQALVRRRAPVVRPTD